MTNKENIEVIRRACVAANPEKWEPYCSFDATRKSFEPIRLADVLLAIQEADTPMGIETSIMRSLKRDPNEMYLYYRMGDGERILCAWNLREDLENQSPETIQFLATLLLNN